MLKKKNLFLQTVSYYTRPLTALLLYEYYFFLVFALPGIHESVEKVQAPGVLCLVVCSFTMKIVSRVPSKPLYDEMRRIGYFCTQAIWYISHPQRVRMLTHTTVVT